MGLKPTNEFRADSPSLYTREKILNLSTIHKVHLKNDVDDGSVVNGIRKPILFSFILNKPPGHKVFCEPETTDNKKINKSVWNTITFSLEDNEDQESKFNAETLTFFTIIPNLN